MSSTVTAQDVIDIASIFARGIPLTGVNGVANEPGLTMLNECLGFILSPPFAWPWNRATVSFTAAAGTQSYTQSVPTFGWAEAASVTVNSVSTDIDVVQSCGDDTNQQRPVQIAAQSMDGSGNVTFKLLPAPDQAYTVNVTYQSAAPFLTELTSTLTPIPDYLSYLVQQLVRVKVYEMQSDPRLPSQQQLALQMIQAVAQRQASVGGSAVAEALEQEARGITMPGPARQPATGRRR